MLPHTRQSGETTTSIPAGHIVPTPTQLVGGGGLSGNRTHDLFIRSRAFYGLSYRAPGRRHREKKRERERGEREEREKARERGRQEK